MALKDYESAISDFKRVVQIDPKQAEAFIKMGSAQRALKDHAAAVEAFSQAVVLAPYNANLAYQERGLSRLEL